MQNSVGHNCGDNWSSCTEVGHSPVFYPEGFWHKWRKQWFPSLDHSKYSIWRNDVVWLVKESGQVRGLHVQEWELYVSSLPLAWLLWFIPVSRCPILNELFFQISAQAFDWLFACTVLWAWQAVQVGGKAELTGWWMHWDRVCLVVSSCRGTVLSAGKSREGFLKEMTLPQDCRGWIVFGAQE